MDIENHSKVVFTKQTSFDTILIIGIILIITFQLRRRYKKNEPIKELQNEIDTLSHLHSALQDLNEKYRNLKKRFKCLNRIENNKTTDQYPKICTLKMEHKGKPTVKELIENIKTNVNDIVDHNTNESVNIETLVLLEQSLENAAILRYYSMKILGISGNSDKLDDSTTITNLQKELRYLESGGMSKDPRMYGIYLTSQIIAHILLLILHLDYLWNTEFTRYLYLWIILPIILLIICIFFDRDKVRPYINLLCISMSIFFIIMRIKFILNLHNLALSLADRKTIKIKSVILLITMFVYYFISHPLYKEQTCNKCPIHISILFSTFITSTLIILSLDELITKSQLDTILKISIPLIILYGILAEYLRRPQSNQIHGINTTP